MPIGGILICLDTLHKKPRNLPAVIVVEVVPNGNTVTCCDTPNSYSLNLLVIVVVAPDEMPNDYIVVCYISP
jgi:hypothetical protein